MALLKAVKTNFGIDVTYWNIYSINEEYKNKSIEVILAGYISKQTRDAELAPVTSKTINLIKEEYIADATREAVYLALKAKDFSDAVDA
jgi:endonuclease III